MYKAYQLSQRIIAYVLLSGLFLQSCTRASDSPIVKEISLPQQFTILSRADNVDKVGSKGNEHTEEENREQEKLIEDVKRVSKRFIFIRHGITDWNWRLIPKGPQDLSLNKDGEKHINTIAKSLTQSDIRPKKILTSTLRRCLETTKIIEVVLNQGRRYPLIVKVDQLNEIYRGNWASGSDLRKRKVKDLVESYSSKVKGGKITEEEVRRIIPIELEKLGLPPDAEGWKNFKERVCKTLDNILENEPSDTLIVSHGVVIKEYLKSKQVFTNSLRSTWVGDDRPALIVTRYPDGSLEVKCFYVSKDQSSHEPIIKSKHLSKSGAKYSQQDNIFKAKL